MQDIQMTLPIGTILRDRYVVEELLGKGGFGAVYLVRDLRVKQNQFALKELIDSSKLERERFTFEGEVLKRVDHPALPRIYRVFDDDKSGRAYILMDYIEGSNLEILRQQQPEKRFSLSRVLFLIAPIIDAASYLHHQNPPIIHRDIKPANIIVPRTGEGTVLVDFGIAKEYDPDSTTTAVRRASPGYGAPEQYTRGTNTCTDVYGLGATIYALLTGLIPADAFHRMTQMGSTGVDPLEPVNHLVPSIPQPVSDAISRAMAMRSEDRFPTVEKFWQALNAFPVNAYLAQQQRLVPVIGPSTPVPASVSAKDTTVGAFRQEQPRRSSKLGLLLLLLAALLIGTGVAAGFFVYTSSHRTANAPTLTPAHPTPKPTHHPNTTPTPSPNIASTPTTVPPAFPPVGGEHNGSIHNTTGGLTATMSLSIRQDKGAISGNFRVNSPLQGSGPFTGNVTTTSRIQFIVHSNQVAAPLYFWGTVQAGGSMQGNYCSLDRTNHCNPNAGGAGLWNAGPASTPSSSVPSNELQVINTSRHYGARYGVKKLFHFH